MCCFFTLHPLLSYRAKIVEEDEELEENAKKNKIYDDFLVFRAGNENFINKASQTINDAPKTKSTQTVWAAGFKLHFTPPLHRSVGPSFNL